MKNLLKYTLGVVAATVALAVLASAAIAATPTLSPVPKECGETCETKNVGATGLGAGEGGAALWAGWPGSWAMTGPTGGNVTFESSNEGTTFRMNALTFENGKCNNEGLKFNTSALEGHLGVLEGSSEVGILMRGNTGLKFGKCTFSGSPTELTGQYIGTISPTNTPTKEFTVSLSGQGREKFETQESGHVISASVNGGSPGTVDWTGSFPLTTSETVELHRAGRTATFVTPKYVGGFGVIGGAMKFVSKNGLSVTCKYMSGGGAFTSATGGHLTLSFTGCKGPLGTTCNGGEVTTTTLKALLAYTYPAKETAEGRQTALVLSPESGTVVNEFVCGTVKSVVRGAVMAVISPLAKSSSTFALTLKQAGGVEEHTLYEGTGGEGTEAKLETSNEGGPFQQSGLEVTSPSVKLNDGGEETIK